MTKPAELAEAETILALCRLQNLPWPGSVLEQPAAALFRWLGVLAQGSGEVAEAPPEVNPLAGLTETL